MPQYPAETAPERRNLFKAALKNPKCLWPMIALAQSIVIEPDYAGDGPVARRARRAAYDVQSRCVAWITQPRGRAELDALVNRECTCTAAERKSIWHARVQTQFQKILNDHVFEQRPFFFLVEIFLWPMARFLEGPEGRPLRMKQLGRRTRWPSSISDMLPHGAEDTTRSLIYLLELDLNAGARDKVMYALDMLMVVFHPLVMPTIVTSRTLIMKGVIAGIHDDMDHVTSAGRNIKPGDVRNVYESQFTLLRVVTELVSNATHVQRKTFHEQAPAELLIAYDRATKLFPLLQANTSHLRPEHAIPQLAQPDPFFHRFKTIGGKLLNDVPAAWDILPQLEAENSFRDAAMSVPEALWLRFIHTIHILDVGQHCMAPGCTETALTNSLKHCGGCQRVRYCSHACQKAAWRHHRTICQMLALVCAELAMPRAEVLASPTAYMPVVERVTPLRPSIEAIIRHFDALAQLRMANSSESTHPDL
jgi:hypothetical protein